MQKAQKVDNERKSLKANAAEGIIAIVENAKTNRGGKPDLKSHVKNRNNAKKGFSYYKSEFAIPNGSGKYDLVGTSIIVRNADNGKSYVYDFDDIKIKKKGLSLESVKNTESLSNLTPEKVNVSAPSITDVSTNDQTKSRLQGENDTRNSKDTDIDDLLDDDMFESLFNDGFIDELEDELDVKKHVNWNWMNELMDSLEESIKAAESGTKRERKKAQRHLTKAVVGKEFVTNGKKVAFKDERIDKYLDSFAASNKDYAQAYITYMSPAQFLLLTANGDKGNKTFEWIKEGSHPFNEAEFLEETQPIFLDLDEKKNGKGEIVGHEGRHRMFAFGKAGFSQIPVLVFNYRNKYDKHHIDSITLTPQKYNYETKYNKSNLITLTDLEPLSTGNRDTIIAKFGSGAEADVRYSKDTDGKELTPGQNKYFKNSLVRDENGNLMVMYHGARGAGFTVFDPAYSDDQRSLFFTNKHEVAKTYSGTYELFEPDKAFTYEELEQMVSGYGGDIYIERDGDDVVLREYGMIGEDDPEVYRGDIKGAANYFVDAINDIRNEGDAVYKVYLNITNPYIVNANGNNWDELPIGKWETRYADVQITDGGNNTYTVDYADENGEWFNEVMNWEQIQNKFGITEKYFQSGEMFFSDIYLNDKGEMIPTNTRQLSAYAKEHGYDGVIINDVLDIGLYASNSEDVTSTVVIAFDSNQVKSVHNQVPTENEDIRYSLVERDDYITEDYEAPVEESILKEGLKALKKHEVNRKAVKKIAVDLINEYHSNASVSQVTNDISKAFAYLSTQEHMTYKDAARIMEEIAKPMLEASNDTVGDEEYNNFISAVGKVRLTDNQMKEVKKMFGSYGEFKAMVSPLQINMNATVSLDDVWQTIVDNSYGTLDYDTTENDQVFAIYDAIRSLRPSIVNQFGGDLDEASKEAGIRIIEEYLRNDGKADTAKALKQGREEYRNKVKSQYNERLKRAKEELAVDRRWQKNLAKRDYQEALKQGKADYRQKLDEKYNDKLNQAKEKLNQDKSDYRQKLNEKYDEKVKRVKLEADVDRMWQRNLAHQDYLDRVAELRARNKQLALQKAETVRANKVKKSIEQNVVKLQKWIANPSEEHHVPMDMVEPILEFMTALDFVEPEIKTDGKTFYVNIFDHMEYHNGRKSPQYIRIEGKTKAEVRDKFYAQLDRGIGSARQRTWVDRMRAIKDLYDEAVKGNNFTNSDVTDFVSQLDGSLVDELSELIKNANGKIYVNDFDSKQLTVVDKVVKNIIQVVNRGNKAAAQNADIKLLSEDTIGRSKGKVMSQSKVRQLFLLDMATPLSYFDNMGDGASKIYRGLRNGFNTKIRDIRTASEFMENLISPKKAKGWTGNNPDYKTFNIGGRKIDLTVAQIMSLYELVKRDQTLGHLKGGFTPTTFKTGKFNKITHNLDERPVHFTDEEIIRITDTLTDEQKRVADEMQHFLADTCSGWGNEVSRNLYGYEKFLDPNYFPITSDKNYLMSNNENTAFDSLNGIERSGFTKQVIKNASNPIVIADIFDVFTKHVNDMATYHGFAAPIKDANRWFNYKTVESLDEDVKNYSSVKDAISRLSGQGGQQYYIKLIKDLNGMEKSQYIASFTDRLMSGYKSAAVGGNLRVVIQQPTAFFRAANIIDPKYLASALVSPREARRIGKMMREQSEIAWWKSQGYFETSIGKSMKNIITGQESTAERIKDFAMSPAGVADDITWGVLYTAVAKEQSALGLKGDELEKAIKDRFDEVVDQTQVVDSTLHRSQYMRSQDTLNKIQTAFMAEPIKSYNMLMRAAMTGEKSKMSRAAITFIVTNVITAAAASLIDAFRRDDDDKDWGEEYVKAFKEGVIDNVNPLNLIPILKDVMNTIVNMGLYQTQSNRMDLDAVNSAVELIGTWKKYITGDSNKTWYGMLMATARPASQITGIPAYNIMRDASALYNAFFPDLKKTISTNQYAEVYDLIKQGKDVDRIEEAVKKVIEKGGSISDIESGISSRYKSDYFDMYQVDPNEAQKLGDKAARGYAAIGMDDEEIEGIIDSWKEESITYPKLYKAIMSGEGIEEQIDKLREAGKADDKIAEKVADKFFDTIVYADENEISSPVKKNTDKAIKYITGMDFDSYIEAEEQAAIEAEAEKAAKAKATAEKKAKAAENKAIKQEKTGHKQNLYNNIDNGGDFKTNVEKIHQDGTDYDQIKSLLTKEYKGKNLTQQQKSRIATIKAYCDEKSGTKIAKKYNGNYYQYELDEINKW